MILFKSESNGEFKELPRQLSPICLISRGTDFLCGLTPSFLSLQHELQLVTDDETIDPNQLDQHTLREVKRIVESYPVVTSDKTYHELDSYRQGKRDAYNNVAAVLSDWIDDFDGL